MGYNSQWMLPYLDQRIFNIIVDSRVKRAEKNGGEVRFVHCAPHQGQKWPPKPGGHELPKIHIVEFLNFRTKNIFQCFIVTEH